MSTSASTLAKITPTMSTADSTPETRLLAAASTRDLATLRLLLRKTSAQTQDPSTLNTPLHLVILSLTPSSSLIEAEEAEDCIRLLLQEGAIWNDVNKDGDTPGCLAYKLGGVGEGCYEVMVEAGLGSDDDDDEEMEEVDGDEAPQLVQGETFDPEQLEGLVDEEQLAAIKEILAAQNGDGGVAVGEALGEDIIHTHDGIEVDVNSSRYLSSKLGYDDEKLLDADENGVMMSWETGIMERSVEELLPDVEEAKGKRVLNVGFGMGIVDSAFQARIGEKGTHVIVEAHPDVLKKIESDGWEEKPGVRVLKGRWQEALQPLLDNGEVFDAIYFDTFAEEYTALKSFFEDYVIALLAEGGRFSFFHGLGADKRISYDVYTRVVEIDLLEAGLETEWMDVDIELKEEEWNGVRRRYWDVGSVYRLPVCTFIG
ncbi:Similar to Arginine N-methyltransferase 2; acc. no. Q4X1R1 [Pyronema omphalodes CBS 100304]|uniref:Arginine N-methyltransferase 2 n=1 Tax=Pyronema omphalodes (strain CBS 100304) TaxID=1076935 RepID=U4L4Y4_PYROM|nr:Similar to Arginine N-methyltransferase 2; acc. no. Q4X1R1 [Pyronema omphalodes CBS 100304]